MTLGDKLAKLRKERNYTQEELADLLHVSRQAVSKWESDLAYPETDKLLQLGKLYDCSMDYLLKDIPDAATTNDNELNSAAEAEKGLRPKKNYAAVRSAVNSVCAIGVTAVYLALGFTLRLWHPGWLLFFLIPTVATLAEAIVKRQPSHFAYPVPITAVFLLVGLTCGVWHPTWLLFLTIPVYYIIADLFKRK